MVHFVSEITLWAKLESWMRDDARRGIAISASARNFGAARERTTGAHASRPIVYVASAGGWRGILGGVRLITLSWSHDVLQLAFEASGECTYPAAARLSICTAIQSTHSSRKTVTVVAAVVAVALEC
eukprot:COSAG02_NODE_146_length_33985_cov_263.461695_5_plen_127_part_00